MIRIIPSFRFTSLLPAAKPFCSVAYSSSPAKESPRCAAYPDAKPTPVSNSLSVTPKTPLFLRPSLHATPLSEVWKWHDWAKDLASSVEASTNESEDGLESVTLHRELKWVIEDSMVDYPLVIHHRSQIGGDSEKSVILRASLDELYDLWRQRIENRRPFQYVVGCENWRDLVLCVEEGVLIPRPETELIVDMVEELVESNDWFKKSIWADLGTGSGAIAIGVAKVLGTRGRVIATDLSPVAIVVAANNVHRYDLQGMIEVRQGSWFEPLKDLEGKLVGIVSNPPYIPSKDIPGLQAEVGRHEPKLALDGGIDGTDSLRQLCHGACRMLKRGGFFAFEGHVFSLSFSNSFSVYYVSRFSTKLAFKMLKIATKISGSTWLFP